MLGVVKTVDMDAFFLTTRQPVHRARSPYDVSMLKHNARTQNPAKPSPQAVRRAVASSTAIETGLTVEQLEQKLQNRDSQRDSQRFAHVQLAA
ncbi:hypothetical protein GCM10022279_33060 [Comamonas faecalis]|uniref:Uncharacterized protein n=2 Tax=Comamonas faecalis TaxID=1387849 RepID=A0ABP7S4B9_9BURK